MKEDALSYPPEPELQTSRAKVFRGKRNSSLSTILIRANIDNAEMKQSCDRSFSCYLNHVIIFSSFIDYTRVFTNYRYT